ncbi:hypothetical protein CEXT_312641 [Caerostris extrusa]|uniref:Uncharacterized protein n=1 Tax=Caerostris extrusa TaxID=172846 RepID=A0AAV4UIZ5_CAEEX|nr:hypothetical protein CEXT_312641 [Caerostris extrusa]
MACNPYRYKTFLVSTNIALLFVGMAVFILGINMQQLLSSLPFIAISPIAGTIKAVIAAGFFILVTGVTGVGFACIESLWFFFLVSIFKRLLHFTIR